MIEIKETVDKVIEFAQSETNTKSFRPDYPVSEELRESMLNTFSDFMDSTRNFSPRTFLSVAN